MDNFERLLTSDLLPTAVVAQSVDNQWIPPELLGHVLKHGKSIHDVQERLERQARADYIRALINSPQVLVNRAFLYNNPLVFKDFTEDSPDRDSFIALANSGAIVQFLLGEHRPDDRPAALSNEAAANYTVLQEGWEAWRGIVDRARVHSARFSWDSDAENAEQLNQRLARKFTEGVMRLVTLEPQALSADLGVDLSTAHDLKHHLVTVTAHCAELAGSGELVTREKLYQKFIVQDGTTPAEGRYDLQKPHCGLTKQLIDLAYNVNIAAGVERLALTPALGMHRSTLQEWRPLARDPENQISAPELADVLSGAAFDFVQQTLYLQSFRDLTIRDVEQIRGSDEWLLYSKNLNELLASPFDMFESEESGAKALMDSYVGVLRKSTRVALKRPAAIAPTTEPRDFAVALGVEVAGSTFSYCFGPTGPEIAVTGGALAAGAANVVVRLGVRGWNGMRKRRAWTSDLDNRVQLMSGWVNSADEFWRDFLARFEDVPGTDQARELLLTRHSAASMDRGPGEDFSSF